MPVSFVQAAVEAADPSALERLGLADLPGGLRVAAVLALALAAHLLVRLVQRTSEWLLTRRAPGGGSHEAFQKRYPKAATVLGLATSAIAFVVYFLALGLVLQDLFGVNLTAYFATASVIGLAIAFGSQGLVQDVVTGLTLIFSDVLDVGDMVEVSGQVGRVERIGLRFTQLTNFLGQAVYIPNRNIAVVGRFRRGAVRAYVDVQLPAGVDESEAVGAVEATVRGFQAQHRAVLVREPELLGVRASEAGGWRYLRVKLRLWPGQGALLETALRQRLAAAMKALEPGYADWMITIVYRVE